MKNIRVFLGIFLLHSLVLVASDNSVAHNSLKGCSPIWTYDPINKYYYTSGFSYYNRDALYKKIPNLMLDEHDQEPVLDRWGQLCSPENFDQKLINKKMIFVKSGSKFSLFQPQRDLYCRVSHQEKGDVVFYDTDKNFSVVRSNPALYAFLVEQEALQVPRIEKKFNVRN